MLDFPSIPIFCLYPKSGMTLVKTEIHIKRPAHEVFEFISNPENNPVWQNGMQSCLITSEGVWGLGSTYDQKAKFLGRDIVSHFKITAFEAGRMIRGDTVESSFPISFTRIVEPDNLGTGANVRAEVSGDPNGFFRLFVPLMNWMVGRSIRGDYRRLKAILED